MTVFTDAFAPFLVDTVTVETKTGTGQSGPVVASPFVVDQVMVTREGKRYMTSAGIVATSAAEVYGDAGLGPRFVPGSLVTLTGDTKKYKVAQTNVLSVPNLPSSMVVLLEG